MSDVNNEINEIKKKFEGIDRAILDGSKHFRRLQASVSSTNDILKSTNWVIFSRFISGTPLWRLQNRVKASVMLLNEYLSTSERARLKQAEQLKQYAELAKSQKEINEMNEELNVFIEKGSKISQEEIADLEKRSEIFSGLMFKYNDANKAARVLQQITQEQVNATKKLQNAARASLDFEKASFKEKMKHYSGLKNAQKSFSAFKEMLNKKELKQYMFGKDKELKITNAMKKKAGKLGVDTEGLLDKSGKVAAPRETQGKDGKLYRFDAKGKRISSQQFNKLSELADMAKKQNGMRAKMMGMLKAPFKALKSIAAGIVKMVFYAAAQFMKMLLLLMVVVAAFKFIQPFLGNIYDGIKTMADVFMASLGLVYDSLAAIGTGVYNVVAGIMNMDLMQIAEGIGGIVVGFLGLLVGLLSATVGTLLAGIWGFVSSLFMDGFNKLGGGLNGIIGGIGNVIKGVSGVVAAIALVVGTIGLLVGATFALPALLIAGVAAALYFAIDPLVSLLTGIVSWINNLDFVQDFKDKVMDSFLGDLIRGIQEAVSGIVDKIPSPGDAVRGIANKIPFLATGGAIKNSGIAVVGERGPELVNLPAGARVSSNRDSAAMMGGGTTINNHITVQVTGRVGANDTEIRDIANKVAKEINSRMNRTATSVVRF